MLPTTTIALPTPAPPVRRPRTSVGRTAVVVAVVTLLLTTSGLLLSPRPLAALGAPGSLVGTLLPWSLSLVVPAALLAAALRSRGIAAGLLALALTWTAIFAPALVARIAPDTATLSIITENVHAENQDAAATALSLAARHPDVIALQELTPSSAEAIADALAGQFPYLYRVGSIGVWSTLPLSDGSPLALGLSWNRALRVDVASDAGPVRLYVVHAASLRVTGDGGRETMLTELRAELADDESDRLLVAGDLNGGSLDPVVAPLRDAADEAPDLRPTWPADAPLVRLDHVLVRGFDSAGSVLPANGSDHLGVEMLLRAR
ncbi:hypothetical protein C5C18_14665 [Rathayibacter tritici]|uniref:endonuclease/exonuclease/phosphatase family protein n=1 Tax=Rathayibacter tritici TaxID=33888 RepID=UPI000CE74B9C|nr:endonuclease/exonuclease/phosphatase family protein [Rathayibacter tritici]PPF23607.1 hypothetical protein C5C06_13955 [Rathayibacter tritici]PPF63279.1 hypothetical protein C5C21_13250 [Rathayibacter tritici]PPG02238.1 hypothetical protein C5C18_14665 [Rathayibacter tritici]PPI17888.1 hypothetical protein C5D07_04355 [Rathayibacter tritici]